MTSMPELHTPKVILITGVAGFIASNAVRYLLEQHSDIHIIGVDKLSYCSSVKNVSDLANPRYEFIKADIRSADIMSYLLAKNSVDTVIHFAAQTHVDNSFGNSLQFTEDNVIGTHVLIECCKQYGKIKRFVHMSTDEVYGETVHGAVNEDALLQPTNPYAATKAAAEMIVKSYERSFKMPLLVIRGNNIYGPRQFPEKVIPKFVYQLRAQRPCTLHGGGHSVRSYLYVDDAVAAVDMVTRYGTLGETYNIAGDTELSIKDLAANIIKTMGLCEQDGTGLDKWLQVVDDRPFNDQRYHVDDAKLRKLGWSPKVHFQEGLANTVNWFLSNVQHWDAAILSEVLCAHPRVGANK
eukprot:ANDGO_04956.mRNA.1 Trifunctional UDP-glucose 4